MGRSPDDEREAIPLQFLLLLIVYLVAVLSTSAIVFHNHPVSVMDNVSGFGDVTPRVFAEQDKTPGVTFGTAGEAVSDQDVSAYLGGDVSGVIRLYEISMLGWWCSPCGLAVTMFLLSVRFSRFLFLIPGLLLHSILYSAFVFGYVSVVRNGLKENLRQYPVRNFTIFGVLDLLFELLSFEWLFEYVSVRELDSGESVYETIPLINAIFENQVTTQFWRLPVVHIIVLGTVVLFWTAPYVPERLSKDADALRLHLSNWQKYGTWSATIFVGVVITVALPTIAGTKEISSIVVQHVVILFGGAFVLIIGYLAIKGRKIEERIEEMD